MARSLPVLCRRKERRHDGLSENDFVVAVVVQLGRNDIGLRDGLKLGLALEVAVLLILNCYLESDAARVGVGARHSVARTADAVAHQSGFSRGVGGGLERRSRLTPCLGRLLREGCALTRRVPWLGSRVDGRRGRNLAVLLGGVVLKELPPGLQNLFHSVSVDVELGGGGRSCWVLDVGPDWSSGCRSRKASVGSSSCSSASCLTSVRVLASSGPGARSWVAGGDVGGPCAMGSDGREFLVRWRRRRRFIRLVACGGRLRAWLAIARARGWLSPVRSLRDGVRGWNFSAPVNEPAKQCAVMEA